MFFTATWEKAALKSQHNVALLPHCPMTQDKLINKYDKPNHSPGPRVSLVLCF